jgi:hypothetical protein
MTERMAEAGDGNPELRGQTSRPPKKGDRYRCKNCGMAIEVTADCTCKEGHAHFHCCGQMMAQV